MSGYTETQLSGAMTDPCPVCHLKPARGVNFQDDRPATASDGALTVCFGCALVQIIRDGMRCSLSEDEADWLFAQPALLMNVAAVAKMRAINPMRVGELVREQQEKK